MIPVPPVVLRLTVAALLALPPGLAGADQAAETAATARTAVTAGGQIRVRYEPRPDPIPLNEPFSIRIVVESVAAAAAPADRRVEVRGWMPAHLHGMTLTPMVKPAGDGVWEAEGMLFHMSGHWQLFIDVMDAGKRDRATFDVELQ